VRKDTFWSVKGILWQGKSLPFEGRKRAKKVEKRVKTSLKMGLENLPTAVLLEYQCFMKVSHNSRISERGESFLKSGPYF
jgi:hypothetical protein